ncbi:2OG-Fe(II) oxygenase [Rhodovibrionaceae bacterium A322]
MTDERFDQALTLLEQGAASQALTVLEALLVDTPGHVEAWRLLSRVQSSLGQEDNALQATQKADELEADNLAIAAKGLWNAGLIKQAQASCHKALLLHPTNPAATLLASHLARQAGDFAKTRHLLTRLQAAIDGGQQDISEDLAAQLRYESAVFDRGLTAAGNPDHPDDRGWATPFLRQEDWLPKERHDSLMAFVERHQDQWIDATVWTKGKYQKSADHRVASVLYDPPDIREWFLPMIEAELPRAFEHLNMVPFTPKRMELQVSTYRQGEYYRAHRDTAWPEAEEPQSDGRVLTFVYYFSRQPQRFQGGDLKLYDTNTSNGVLGDGHSLVRPQDNSLILFPSVALHEVCPLELNSTDPLDGRFTVNGWLHR